MVHRSIDVGFVLRGSSVIFPLRYLLKCEPPCLRVLYTVSSNQLNGALVIMSISASLEPTTQPTAPHARISPVELEITGQRVTKKEELHDS